MLKTPPATKSIVLFATADWDNPFWTNKQHMAVEFARRGYRVLYVDSLGLRRPTFSGSDTSRVFRRLMRALPWPRQVRPNIWRASPLVLPWHGSAAQRALNDGLLRGALRIHMRVLGMRRPLIWTYNPVIWELCSTLPHCGLVYHCVDDLRAAPGIASQVIEASERCLGEIADLCFTTSPALQERMSEIFPHSIYEPNVCDQTLFAAARIPQPEPADLAGIPHPRLLFVGALSQYKVDFALMEAVAQRLPQVHWILIGSEGEGEPGSRKAPRLPNIHQLGPRQHTNLPRYMAHVEAAVLPAPHNKYTDAMFPMKFFEYLSAGLPLITTDLPALREFAPLIFVAEGEKAFAAAVEQVLAGKRRDQQAIDKICQHHSWKARFDRMETAFFPLLNPCG